ncbi:hypothetical protein J2W78_000487 [Methylorubrum extorquens]|nr:hypothetical protein [Methylorubrum extorquens]
MRPPPDPEARRRATHGRGLSAKVGLFWRWC